MPSWCLSRGGVAEAADVPQVAFVRLDRKPWPCFDDAACRDIHSGRGSTGLWDDDRTPPPPGKVDVLEIDGSLHSGSGTIVRQAVVYAALTGRPVQIRNARARRPHPGLRPQHLRAIEAVRDLVGGVLEGAEVGSRSVVFTPVGLAPAGQYAWDIGTAGSATMLALAILPLLASRGRGVEAEIRGGLFQDFAPSPFHLQHVLLPMLAQMGVAAEIDMVRPGYVPAGEGVIRLAVPLAGHTLRPLVPRRGRAPARVWGIALSSHLDDRRVSARMAAAARPVLDAAGISAAIEERSDAAAAQPGAAFALFAEFIGGARLGADRAGAPHRRAESIGALCVPRIPSTALTSRVALPAARP